MSRRLLVYMALVILFAIFIGGCTRRGYIITVGPTGLDPDAKPPTIRANQQDVTLDGMTEPDKSAEEIMERISSAMPDGFDCDAETAKLEEQLAIAREQNSETEEEFLDVLTELSTSQSLMEKMNTSEASEQYARAQEAYDQMEERAEETRETVKSLKPALRFVRDRCEKGVQENASSETATSMPTLPEENCDSIDTGIEDIENAHNNLFDAEQDRLDELEERYELDDELDEAQANGDDTEDIQADIDDKDEMISSVSDGIADRKEDLDELRRSLDERKDSCMLPRDITRICTSSQETIDETIDSLSSDIQEIEEEIEDLRRDHRRAIEEGDAGAQNESEEELVRARSGLRQKQESFFEEEDNLAAHEAFC